jgi:hypothetical protein
VCKRVLDVTKSGFVGVFVAEAKDRVSMASSLFVPWGGTTEEADVRGRSGPFDARR